MKVLMTADTVGGVFTYAVDLLKDLEREGADVLLATLGRPCTPEQRALLEPLGKVELVESAYRLEWMADPWDDLQQAADWLLALERRFQPDIVHLNHLAHGALPWRTPVLTVAHSCVVTWWRSVHGCEAPQSWDRYREVVRASLRTSDAVLAPSLSMLKELRRCYGTLPEARVIRNRRNDRSLRPGPKDPFIFTAGRLWDEAKNLRLVAQVAHALEWPVYAAGEGAQESTGSLHGLGALDSKEMGKWMRRASIYCLPALYEPFGLSVLEAALSGCALVLGDIVSLRENWDGAARFVNPREPASLRQALEDLTRDPQLLQELQIAARERALAINAGSLGAEYTELYAHVLEAACVS